MPPPLLTAVDCTGHIHLIIGSNSLANARCIRSLEVGAQPKIIAPPDAEVHYLLAKRIEDGEVEWVKKMFQDEDVTTVGREEVGNVVDAVFVTDGSSEENASISRLCKRNRIPVNVVDSLSLCTFTLLSTHSDGPLQIGITTSGNGCKLASRIRREIATTLPQSFGAAISRLGSIRREILEEKQAEEIAENHKQNEPSPEIDDDTYYPTSQPPPFNSLVSSFSEPNSKSRRLRWLAQICEYYPLTHLAALTSTDISTLLSSQPPPNTTNPPLLPFSPKTTPHPRIILAGSGLGHPSLLTLATHHHLQTATLILADKLIPPPILALIPRRTPLHIARKFPGNADAAQDELLTLALAALRRGETVLRLKQGDPFLYGRGGEEVLFFRRHGFEPVVVPGVTSALAGPLVGGVPVTQRGVADQVLICTGTGRKGVLLEPPEFVEGRSVVLLMALHRLGDVVGGLVGGADAGTAAPAADTAATADGGEKHGNVVNGTSSSSSSSSSSCSPRNMTRRMPWPPQTPCAIIERASLPDQRVIRSSLERINEAVLELGSRPPGLLVVGGCCDALLPEPPGGEKEGKGWVVEEGGGLGGWEEMVGVGVGADAGLGLGGGLRDDVEEGREVVRG